jgi:regulator of chromosome condensation
LKKGVKLVSIASSYNATIALTSTGKVYEWGACHQRVQRRTERANVRESERKTQLEPLETRLASIKAIYAGGEIQFAIAKNGDVYGWGINGFGQLGNGNAETHELPVKIKGFPADIKEIACGQSHTLLLTQLGQVYSFGRNAYGQLGHGEDEPAPPKGSERKYVSTPKLVEFFERLRENGEKVIQVAAGDQHSAVVTDKGSLYTFGFAEQYRLGNCSEPGDEEDDVLIPYKVASAQIDVRDVKFVACGTDHTVVIATKKAGNQ